jgi:hypothetical protein
MLLPTMQLFVNITAHKATVNVTAHKVTFNVTAHKAAVGCHLY